MNADLASEQPRPLSVAGSSDAVTFAFGDAAADVYGVARLGLAPPADGSAAPVASGLAILFSGGEILTARAEGAAVPVGPGWEGVRAAGLQTTIDDPLRLWTVIMGVDDGAGFELQFAALAPPAVLDEAHPVARVGGMQGYESYCRVTGTVTVGGVTQALDGVGQRSHSWGAPDWDRLTIARTLSIWLDERTAVSLSAVREQSAREHDGEHVVAFLTEPPEEGAGGAVPHLAEEVLLSTTYDMTDCQRGASLELYLTEDGHARRAAGEVICGTTLDLGRLRLDCAFFRWNMEGRVGIGRYDVLRRT